MYQYRVVTTSSGRYQVQFRSNDAQNWYDFASEYIFKTSAIRAVKRHVAAYSFVPKVVYGPYP